MNPLIYIELVIQFIMKELQHLDLVDRWIID